MAKVDNKRSVTPDIKVSLYDYIEKTDIKRGKLALLCEGTDCNVKLILAIGRISVNRIPTYAFARELIKIEKINPETGYHDSIPFNYDMMRRRLMNTPVMNVDPEISFLHERHWKGVDYRNQSREKHEKEKRIEAYIDAKNTAPENEKDSILHITTNDMKVYIDDVLTQIYSKEYPLLLISLKPREAFKCSLKAVLGVGLSHSCWDACTNYYFDTETEPNKIIVHFQSPSGFDEFKLVNRSLEYFKMRTLILKDEIKRLCLLQTNNTGRYVIEIVDEDHTMGEPINYEFQSHPNILKSGCVRRSLDVRNIIIDVCSTQENKNKLIDSMMESIDNLIVKIDKFQEEFNNVEANMKNGNDGNNKEKSKEKTKDKSKEKTLKRSKKKKNNTDDEA
jgi:hypothetical protein